MRDTNMPASGAAPGDTSRAVFGMGFWSLLMIVEILVMIQAAKLAYGWAEAMQYGLAAAALIGATALCGLAIFAAWHKQSRIEKTQLAAQRHAALARKAEAEAQAQQKSRLLATMSHEIRTPLNGVIGMLALMLETELDAQQKNYAGIAHSSARSLLSFLDEILDTAKAEARPFDGRKTTDLLPLIETVAELMAPRAHAKGIEISTFVSAVVPPTVPFNNLHLRQILFNLAGNAIKFTASGGVAIEATFENQHIRIDVRDTGIGMTDEECSRVFAEYEQANGETSRRFGGTGLGLAISRRLAEAMNGTLTVASRVGEGTTFSLRLPLSVQTETRDAPLLGRRYGLWLSPSLAAGHLARKLADLGADVVHPGETELETCHAIICDPLEARTLVSLRKRSPELADKSLWVLLNPEERRNLKDILDEPSTGYLVKPLRSSTLVKLLTGRDDASVAQGAAMLRKLATRSPSQKGLRLLLVDDTPVNLLLASTMLRKSGHEVTTLDNGADALALLNTGVLFDALLLDVEMPRMSGHDVARQIRAMGRHDLPILALTGNAAPEDVAACLASGMNDHLAKPFDQDDLDDALARIARAKVA